MHYFTFSQATVPGKWIVGINIHFKSLLSHTLLDYNNLRVFHDWVSPSFVRRSPNESPWYAIFVVFSCGVLLLFLLGYSYLNNYQYSTLCVIFMWYSLYLVFLLRYSIFEKKNGTRYCLILRDSKTHYYNKIIYLKHLINKKIR